MTTTDVMWSRNLMSMQHLHTHTHTHTHTHQQKVLGQDSCLRSLPDLAQLAQGAKIMPAKILPKIWQDLSLLARSRPLPRSCSSWQESYPKKFCWDQTLNMHHCMHELLSHNKGYVFKVQALACYDVLNVTSQYLRAYK